MGSCGVTRKPSSSVIISTNLRKEHSGVGVAQNNNTESPDQINKKEESTKEKEIRHITEEDKFKDFEEYENEFVGEGIKRMKAFKSNLPFDQLNKLKHEFWSSKKEDKKIWTVIKQACESDHLAAIALLQSMGIVPISGCINQLIDNNDKIYAIPNFCINDPLVKKELCSKENIKAEQIIVKVIDIRDPTKPLGIKVASDTSCIDLKKCYCKVRDVDMNKYKIRAIYMGTEILDDHLLAQHCIKGNSTIQMIVSEILVELPQEDDIKVDEPIPDETGNLVNQHDDPQQS